MINVSILHDHALTDINTVILRVLLFQPKRSEQLTKLGKLIQQLRIQEKGYLDLLQKTKIQVSIYD